VVSHEDEQLVDLLRINVLIGETGVEFFVADPTTADAVLNKLPKNGRGGIEGFE
jgi:hypothetical protein